MAYCWTSAADNLVPFFSKILCTKQKLRGTLVPLGMIQNKEGTWSRAIFKITRPLNLRFNDSKIRASSSVRSTLCLITGARSVVFNNANVTSHLSLISLLSFWTLSISSGEKAAPSRHFFIAMVDYVNYFLAGPVKREQLNKNNPIQWSRMVKQELTTF